ncbi:hypothetical protein CMI47_18305 [Candidatus Pacearchaeota archaeon]|jgi:RNA polymerase sigma factor for flagellar operon FliA|nr:hypothetical protein [Candidatus Pacearchaeota archaeon]|tara:strand:- start:1365 stop:2168 length:804 start_codon:yes stop_codon:yes gene_type:complete
MKKLEEETRPFWKQLMLSKNQENYKQTEKYISARNELAEFYYPIVKKLAILLNKKHGDYSTDDLNSFGSIGLLDAIEKFDPLKDIKFETFATYRIFGSMYDQVRDDNWIPRLSKQRHSIVDDIQKRFLSTHGRSPTDEELIEEIKNKTDQNPLRVLKEKHLKLLYSINNTPTDVDGDVDFYQIDPGLTPDKIVINDSFKLWFDSIDLRSIEKDIIYLVYKKGYTLKETSAMLGISNAKTCSTHKKALIKIKQVFIEEPEKLRDFLIS